MNNSQNANQPIQMNVPPQHPSHQTNQMVQQGHNNFVNQAPPPPQQQQTPVVQQQPQQPASHMSNNPNATNQEMLNKTKKLISDLKESLANLMNLAAKNIDYNYQIDSGVKPQLTSVDKCPRFDKAWSEFNSICNQVETHFKTFQECSLLKKGSKNYVPFNLASLNQIDPNTNDNSITYGQYVNLVKNQVNYSKQIQEILTEGARKISQMDIGLGNQQQQQQNIHNQQQQQTYQTIQHQQSNMVINQHQMQTQHPYQMQMSNHPSPMSNHPSPMMNQMNNQQIPPQQMMHQQQPMQRGPNQLNNQMSNQMNNQIGNQMSNQMNNQMSNQMSNQMGNQMSNQLNNQIPVQQPIMQQQLNNQMANQINNQMPQQMKPQYIPHNQMQ